MDGDRPVAARRDIFESELQKLVREAFEDGWGCGDIGLPDPYSCCYAEREEAYEVYGKRIHELLISYFDSSASDVGSQDETSEEGAMGDGVRSESDLRGKTFQMYICDEIHEIENTFAKEMALRFRQEGVKEAIGHSELTKEPDGSIKAVINYYPQNPR